MGRKRKYANDSQKTKASRYNKKGIEYEIVNGFVYEKIADSATKVVAPEPEPDKAVRDVIGIMIQKQKILAQIYRNRGTAKKALDALYELDLEILKLLQE